MQFHEQRKVINNLLTDIWNLYNNVALHNVTIKYLKSPYTKPSNAEKIWEIQGVL